MRVRQAVLALALVLAALLLYVRGRVSRAEPEPALLPPPLPEPAIVGVVDDLVLVARVG
jgi:hypothetical protein